MPVSYMKKKLKQTGQKKAAFHNHFQWYPSGPAAYNLSRLLLYFLSSWEVYIRHFCLPAIRHQCKHSEQRRSDTWSYKSQWCYTFYQHSSPIKMPGLCLSVTFSVILASSSWRSMMPCTKLRKSLQVGQAQQRKERVKRRNKARKQGGKGSD